jgi:hypothetical protein
MENLHLISWEKGYKKDKWNEKQVTKTGSITQWRNNKTDVKLITYQYQEYRWEKNNKIRKLIVRVPEKNGKGIIELSILTDDLYREATEIIFLMLNRWIQENDFKYLIAHFGLDQITSYRFNDYKNISDTISDKNHVSGQYKALTKELDKLRKKLKTALYKKYEFDIKYGFYQDISELLKGEDEKIIKELSQEFTKIIVAKKEGKPTKRQKSNYTKYVSNIVRLTEEYTEKINHRAELKKNVSKLDEVADIGKQKMDTESKQFMDIVKIIARNMFYLAFEPFKEKYNNYRDDHLMFREITCSDGKIETSDSEILIAIFSKMEISPKIQNILSELMSDINQQNIPLPNKKNQIIRLNLHEKTNSFFAHAN